MAIILDGTNGETFPSWTTAGRPASPATGQTGYNTTLNILETYNGTLWTVSSVPAPVTAGNVVFTTDGSNWTSVNKLTTETAKTYNWNGLTTNNSLEFTNIPSWVKRVTVLINGLSTSGTSGTIYVQIGTGSTPTYTTSGYLGSVVSSGGVGVVNSSGYNFVIVTGIGDLYYGKMSIVNMTGTTWISDSLISRDSAVVHYGAGSLPTLGSPLSAIKILAPAATVFDAGSVNIIYE